MQMSIEADVTARYSAGAREKQAALCCPVTYDKELLALLPHEIVEKDYGCGDPSRYVRAGDSVLDLGSGAGKICYMAAQLVGPGGHVIGVDMNDDMLALARKYQPQMAHRLRAGRGGLLQGYIQELGPDPARGGGRLAPHPAPPAAPCMCPTARACRRSCPRR